MHIAVNLEPSIINQCLGLHYRFHPLGRKQIKKLVWIPLVLLALALYLVLPSIEHQRIEPNFYMGLLYLSFAAGYFFYMRKRMLTSGKTVASSLGQNARFEMEVSPDNLRTITATDTLDTTWDQFTGALMSDQVVLLYQQNGSFSMYHQSFFKDGEFAQFRSWAEEKVQPLIRA